jgi:hypothetical protein
MTLQVAAFAELVIGYVAFFFAFIKPGTLSKGQKKAIRDLASRWGILLQTIGFALAWAYVRPKGYSNPVPALVLSMILVPFAVWLAWASCPPTGQAVALRGCAQRGSRVGSDWTVPLDSPSHLCLDAGHDAGHARRLDLVADGNRFARILPSGNGGKSSR